MRPLLLTPLAFSTLLTAQEPAAPVSLSGPEVARISWDSGSATPADFDGDGKLDLAVINNENAKLVLLYQRAPGQNRETAPLRPVTRNRWEPDVEDSRFEKASLPADQRHFAMAAGDFDGDGKPDLALTGATDALTIRFQGGDAAFAKTWKWKNFEPLQNSQTLAAADFDRDGKPDLAVLGKGRLLVFRQKPDGGFGEPAIYATGEEKAGYLMAEDADNDGATDLLYLAPQGEGSLRFRRQTGPGAFASEIALPFPLPSAGPAPSRDAAKRLILTGVNPRSALIERHAFTSAGKDAMDGDTLLPTLYAPPGGVKGALHARGDFNGDGLTDAAMADSKAAQIFIFLQREDGNFAEPVGFPSLSGITGLTAVPQSGTDGCRLAVSSLKEGCGAARLSADGRLSFPVPLAIKGPPVAQTALQADGSGRAVLAVISGESRAWSLSLANLAGDKPEITATMALKDLKYDPLALKTGDLNGDGRPDLLVLTSKAPALILLAKPDGSGFGEPLAETAGIGSQLTGLAPESTAVIDINGDNRAEIITSGTGYARALSLTPDGRDIAVTDQYNARLPDDKLSTPARGDIDGDGTQEMIFSEAGTPWLQVFQRDAAAVYRPVRRLNSGSPDTTELLPVSLGKSGVPHLFITGRERFRTAPLSGSRPRLEPVGSYETDLRNCRYYMALPGDLNHDGAEEIAAFDSTGKRLEILAPATPWKSLLHFPLFEENIHFRGRKGAENVREAFIRDFTGDGKSDLLILVHDRLLLYPQD